MLKLKCNKYEDIKAEFYVKLLLTILLLFSLSKSLAQAPVRVNQTLHVHSADTTNKNKTNTVSAPLSLPAIPVKNTCSSDFYDIATGGTGNYIYSSLNASVATIDATSGQIHIVGAGTSGIVVTDGKEKATTQLIVDETSPPKVTIAINDSITCLGKYAIFIATPGSDVIEPEYEWFVNGNSAGPKNTNGIYKSSSLKTGDIVVCRMTAATSYCNIAQIVSSNSITVNVVPYSTLSVNVTQSPDGNVPSGTPITFTATPTLTPPYNPAAYTYQWQLNGNDIPNATAAAYTSSCSQNNEYYTCTIMPQNAPCLLYTSKISARQYVHIINSNIPVTASIIASANSVYMGTIINFRATLSSNAQAVAYQWQINGVDTSDVTDELSTFLLKNNDEVRCVIFTDNGCTPVVISNTIKMIIFPTPSVMIPNTFTPNGDGINDVWDIKYLELYRFCNVRVFNRYGSMVFKSKGYEQPWDGKYNGRDLPTGTCYYIIDLGIHTPLLSGTITIIR